MLRKMTKTINGLSKNTNALIYGDLPALIGHRLISSAGEVFDINSHRTVDGSPVRFAHIQEVRPEPANRILGYVSQRLAHGSTEEEGTNGFVNRGDIAAERGLRFDALQIN